jgi:hypothetical protein
MMSMRPGTALYTVQSLWCTMHHAPVCGMELLLSTEHIRHQGTGFRRVWLPGSWHTLVLYLKRSQITALCAAVGPASPAPIRFG